MNTKYRNNGHLTAEDISRWLVEGPEELAREHLQECHTCQSKLTEAQAPLMAFRSALVNWSEVQPAQSVDLHASAGGRNPWRQQLWIPTASFALAALLLAGYVKLPALLHSSPSLQPMTATASTADSDEALLNQVDTEVSEAVPDAMAPLTDLVSWDSNEGSATRTIAAEKHPAHKTPAKSAIVKAPVEVTN